jgi:hypothetical protein
LQKVFDRKDGVGFTSPVRRETGRQEETENMKPITLTPESEALFTAIQKAYHNWSGCPPCYELINKATRGNLTQLKRAGLVITFDSDGEEWIALTESGKAKATAAGLVL